MDVCKASIDDSYITKSNEILYVVCSVVYYMVKSKVNFYLSL